MKRNDSAWRADLGVFVVLLVFCVLAYMLGQAVTPFIVAALFAYVLNPAVNAMARRGAPRGAAVAMFVVLFFIAISAVVLLSAYVLQKEIRVLVDNMPGYMDTFDTRYLPVIRERLGLVGDIDLRAIEEQVKDKLIHISPESASSAAAYALGLISGAVDFFLAALNLLLIPVLMAYLLLDFERMEESITGYLPVAYKAHVLSKLREVEAVLRDFVKGQLMVALIMGVLYSIGLWIVGVDMPVLVGMSAGMLNLVPYLGTTLGTLVSVVLVLLKFQDLLHPALVLAVFGAVQTIEAYVVTPKVVGEKLGLHPVIIIFALVVFGHLLGFVGILLAVPIAAVLKVFIAGFLRDYKASKHYAGE